MEQFSIMTIILTIAFIGFMMRIGFHVGVTLANMIDVQLSRWRNR